MPLYEAVYIAAPTDKIYGVMENHILKFNASTGAKEGSAVVAAPMLGPMRICTDGTSLYVSSWLDRTQNNHGGASPLPTNQKQIWTVNASTLAVTCPLNIDGLWQTYWNGDPDDSWAITAGPGAMKVLNGYIYYAYNSLMDGGARLARMNVANRLDNEMVGSGGEAYGDYQYPEVFDMWSSLGVDYFAYPVANDSSIDYGYIDALYPATLFHRTHAPSTGAYAPTACVYVASKGAVYIVSGSDIMHRYNIGPATVTPLDLGSVVTGAMPTRLRLSPLDGLLYIPSQFLDQIIVWNTATESGIVKTGFDSPIDVVFTATKAFAVQTGIMSLKEIT